MMKREIWSCRRFLTVLSLLLLTCMIYGQQPLNANLVTNGDFETGSTLGWSSIGGIATVVAYGSGSELPTTALALVVGGPSNVYLLRDSSGGGSIRQTIDVTGNASAINSGSLVLEATADLGGFGSDSDDARLRVRFIDANLGPNVEVGGFTVGYVNQHNRNAETVVMRRMGRGAIPSGTTEIRIDVEMRYLSGPIPSALVDNIDARLVTNFLGAPKPLDTNLIVNGDFESGWTPSSVLTPANATGWIGTNGSTTAEPYGAPTVPGLPVATAMGGGLRVLSDKSGGAFLSQTIDISGNAINAPGFEVVIDAFLGGIAGDTDRVRVAVDFMDEIGAPLGSAAIAAVEPADRNFESLVVRRSAVAAVPALTRSVQVRIEFTYIVGPFPDGCVDNIDLRLRAASAPVAHALGAELMVNGDFENGWAPSSPLTITNAHGWSGVGAQVRVDDYGSSNEVPDAAVGAAIGGSNRVASDEGGNGGLRQDVDVRGDAAQIDAGSLLAEVGAFLGGIGGDPDFARVEVTFFDSFPSGGSQVGTTTTLSEATRESRLSSTVMFSRRRLIAIPPSTRMIRVNVLSTYLVGPLADACFDRISVKLLANTPPAPTPLGAQILVNGDFENGAVPGSPFILIDPRDWIGLTASGMKAEPYGADATLPTALFASWISGGSRLAGDLGGSRMRQSVDVSANPQVPLGTLRVHVEGWFGGAASDPDHSNLEVVAIDILGSETSLGTIGNVTPAERSASTAPGSPNVLLFREADFTVPTSTVTLRFDLRMFYLVGPTADGIADNLVATLYDTTLGGADQYPGTGGNTDLHFFTGLNEQPTTGPGFDVKTALGGDILYLKASSFGGNADFAPLVIAYEAFATGAPPVAVIPGVALDPMHAIILIDGITYAGFFGQPIILPGGTTYASAIPLGLAGYSVLVQAFAFPLLAGLPVTPPNGVFFSAAAHEIQFL